VPDLIGRKLGPYEIRDVLGRGGMAVVYRAYQPALNRFVAVKVLNAVMSQDAEFVMRFRQEALAAGGLNHPNILQIYDADTFEGQHYIVMAYAPGGTLADRLRKGPLSAEEATDLAAQVADALNYAHRRGVVHRDIKPSNILLDEEGRPLLADFGIALAASAGPRLTQTGASIGTPEYMSPEQAEGERVDGRSDLFSLGIVLYQMVTGRVPFRGDTTVATMFQIVHQPLRAPREVNPSIPPYLDSIICKALAKDPADRFQSGQEMAQALREHRIVPIPPQPTWDQVTQVARPALERKKTPPPRSSVPERRPAAARGLLIAASILALLVSLGGAAYLGRDILADLVKYFTTSNTDISRAMPADATPVPTAPTATEAPPIATAPTARPAQPTGGVVVAASGITKTPEPTQTPVIVIITVIPPTPTALPTPTAMATATPAPTPTSAPSPVPTRAPATKATTAPTTSQSAVAASGLILDFETFGTWRIGDEPYGSFTQSAEKVQAGQYAGKFSYQIPKVERNYVVFRRIPPAPIPGQPTALKLWVYGDGSGHFLNAWVRDSADEVRQFTFGRVTHAGQWLEMVAVLDTRAEWPQGHISGPDNGKLDYPISLDALVLDAVPDGGGPFSGAIYLDNLEIASVDSRRTEARTTAVPTLATTAAPAGLAGHIVYTRSTGNTTAVYVLDVANRQTWELRGNARQPDIRSDGRVVFNGIGGGKDNIFTVNLDGSQEIMNGLHPEDSYPCWSPSGVSTTFHSSLQGDGRDRIYIQFDMTTKQEPKPLKIGGTDVFGKYPTWLETWRIAFTGCDYWAGGSNCGIWTLNSNGSGNPARVTTDPSDISTDSGGGMLLFASPKTGNWEVYMVPQTGGTPVNLTNHPAHDTGATFSPDLRMIAFMSDRDGGWGIWVMNADGSAPQKLLSVPGFGAGWAEERLAWGP